MPKVTCPVIEYDAGWAYRFGDAISVTFPSHDLARKAAEAAARLAASGAEISATG